MSMNHIKDPRVNEAKSHRTHQLTQLRLKRSIRNGVMQHSWLNGISHKTAFYTQTHKYINIYTYIQNKKPPNNSNKYIEHLMGKKQFYGHLLLAEIRANLRRNGISTFKNNTDTFALISNRLSWDWKKWQLMWSFSKRLSLIYVSTSTTELKVYMAIAIEITVVVFFCYSCNNLF